MSPHEAKRMNWYCHVLTQFGLMNLNVVLWLLAEIIWTILLLWMYVDCLYLVMLLGLKDTNVIIKLQDSYGP